MAATPPLPESLASAKARGNNPSRCGFELCRHILMGVRETRVHRPDLVVSYGQHLLQQHASSLSHEMWAAYEQVVAMLLQYGRQPSKRAAAEVGADSEEMRTAQEYITALSAQFPESQRVKRLEGIMWEAKGEADLAMAEYDDILAEDPSNPLAVKRQIAVCRARGWRAEAAKRLCEYLQTFCSDPEGWLMLHELYLHSQQYKRAAFCIEELILINPMAYIYHIRAGEVTYTMGMASNGGSNDLLLTARKYFAHALELKPAHNLRALYGLLLCCAATSGAKASKASTAELLAFVQPAILEEYASCGGGHAAPMLKLAQGMMDTLAA